MTYSTPNIALLGTTSLFMLVAVLLELLLGFINMDSTQLWSGIFIFFSFVSCIFTIAAAALATEGADSSAVGAEGADNIKAAFFFLFAAPITFRGLVGYLKFKDMRGGDSNNDSA